MTLRLSPPRLLFTPLLLALGLCGGATAQSLQELHTAARAYDAAYLAARANAESAVHRAAQADALRLPSANLGATGARTETDLPVGGTVGVTTGQVAVSGRQSLFNRANGATIGQARKALAFSQADFETAEQDLIVRVSQAYFDVLAAQDTLATTQAAKAAITEQLASAKRNFEVGTATITDTREAQARFDLATAQEIGADNDLRNKRLALDQLVGRANVKPNLLATPVTLPALVPADVEAWVGNAQSIHPTVRKATLLLDIAKLETEKARAGHLPTVDLVGTVASTHANGAGTSTPPGTTNSASLGVQMNLPLFAGFSIQNRVKETLSLEERARNELETARRGTTLTTRQAFFGLQSLQAQVKALEAAESSSKLALESTQLGYRVGVRVNLDVLNAQTQLFQTQRDLAKARYDVLLGTLRLRQASGQLVPGDLTAVGALMKK